MPSGKFHEGSFIHVPKNGLRGMQWQRDITVDSCKIRHIVSDHSSIQPSGPNQMFVYRETGDLVNDPAHHFKMIRVKLIREISKKDPVSLPPLSPRKREGASGFKGQQV